MLRSSILLLVAAFLATACIAPSRAATSAQTPQEIVQGMVDQLGKAIDGHQAELRQHPERMTELVNTIVLPRFDLAYASLLVLGQHARTASPAQRVAFAQAFYKALTRSNAKGLISFAQIHIKVLPSPGDFDRSRTLVRTQVLQSNGKTLAVDYAFRKTASAQWKAYDVIIEGISYITLYRSQVDSEIQKEGIDGVIKRLQTQGVAALGQ